MWLARSISLKLEGQIVGLAVAPFVFFQDLHIASAHVATHVLARVETHVLARVETHVLARVETHVLVQTVDCYVLARVVKHVLARVETHVLARVLLHVLDYYSKTCLPDWSSPNDPAKIASL